MKIRTVRRKMQMKKLFGLIALVCVAATISGCWSEPFAMTKQNTRQTIRNVDAVALDAHPQELYADK